MEQLEFDSSLLGLPEPEADTQLELLPEPEPAPEPPAPAPAPEPAAAQVEESAPAIDFDGYSEREKLLAKQLEELQAERFRYQQQQQPTPQPTPAQQQALRNFFEGMDFDEALANPENMNKVLHAVAEYVIELASTRSAEHTLRTMPKLINQQIMLNAEIDEWWKKNEDLKPFMQTVGALANQIGTEHPEMQVTPVLNEAANRFRRMMHLKAPAKQAAPARKPALVGSNRGRVRGVELSGIAKDVMDLIT